MEKWFISKKKADFDQIGEKFGIDPVIARLIRNRDITDEEDIRRYLSGTLSDVSDPMKMKGVKEACTLLQDALQAGTKIRIISDYDVDGVISNYILWKSLKNLGGIVDFTIPDRIQDGYGMNTDMVLDAKKDGIGLIITCDNGIAAFDPVAEAKKLNMAVIVTDHHEVPYQTAEGRKQEILPPADAVVDPKQEGCGYPYKQLCGAGVAFQLMRALYGEEGREDKELEPLLCFLAIATVCDVVDLTKENRIFVREGLKRIGFSENIGLNALLKAHKLEDADVNSYHLGFVIGPCINASGRLESAEKVLRLFLEKDPDAAMETAQELKELNDQRKGMTNDGVREALDQIGQNGYERDKVLVLYLPDCHESIAGIIAGRVKDKLHKPVFVLTKGKEGIKGSGRSIESYHMFEAMNEVKDVFTKFGGHAMAAGCSLSDESKADEFRTRINECCKLGRDDFIKKVTIDVDMPIDYISVNLVRQMSVLEPFGKENKRPLFAHRKLFIERIQVFGDNRNVIRLSLKSGGGTRMTGMIFEEEELFRQKMGEGKQYITCTYYPDINVYRGNESLQIRIQHYFFT
ncbi:single-stranded-DNA-specific exonuclease RecJ [Anaerostipes sp.]|uniref:single-stranded-DNA-specific exonuclease RecJ n=1 Tax=Anaerostipes sp. TaxID=1872530 RepID=UPI0025BF249F|nr:single-stranded-DNA-specific exonuclease RecJ [Anaerostipes sp.]MBS7007560.1 single-stranded-DNA-specific exonuclease RecJ [Anaerostipes sp.]